ncbi:MAG: DUF2269 family protein [Candidatus Humimicrobiaceae bacterium]
MDNLILASVINFLHLFATVAWLGAMTTNAFILLPSMRDTLEAPVAGKLIGAVMKRFRVLVYTSIGVLIVTGIGMISSMKSTQFTNLWSTISYIKHSVMIIVIILVIYSFEGLSKKVSKLSAKGPSPELVSLQKKQMVFSYLGLVLVLIILLLTGIMTAI